MRDGYADDGWHMVFFDHNPFIRRMNEEVDNEGTSRNSQRVGIK